MFPDITASALSVLVFGFVLLAVGSDKNLTRIGRQTTTPGLCELPEPLLHGQYRPSANKCHPGKKSPACLMAPGAFVPNDWVIFFKCDEGYVPNTSQPVTVCQNGLWEPPLPFCKREVCSSLITFGVDMNCTYAENTVPCDGPMRPGTVATLTCQDGYRLPVNPPSNQLTCLDFGAWDYPPFYCLPGEEKVVTTSPNPMLITTQEPPPGEMTLPQQPIQQQPQQPPAECGLSSKITSEHNTTLEEFPWLAVIYEKGSGNFGSWYEQCVGTLITTHVIVTAAHCLGRRIQPSKIRVGLGKYKRNFYAIERTAVISEVKEVVIHDKYVGMDSYYAADIALLDLVVKVQVTDHIMPACVDWSVSLSPAFNYEGVVAGWVKTQSQGLSYEFAKSARLEFSTFNQCRPKLRVFLKGYLTTDKFCAADIDGSQVNNVGIGGGLTFVKDRKHFLVGVANRIIPDDPPISLFTNITEYTGWLDREKNKLMRSHFES